MKKIMFNDKFGLTKAVIEGRKTQTRQIVPKRVLDNIKQFQEEYYDAALMALKDHVYNLRKQAKELSDKLEKGGKR